VIAFSHTCQHVSEAHRLAGALSASTLMQGNSICSVHAVSASLAHIMEILIQKMHETSKSTENINS